MEYTFYLTDIIEKTGLPHDDLCAIRHSLNDDNVRKTWEAGFEYFEEYQRLQPSNYFSGKRYIFSFISEPGTKARFLGVYEVISKTPAKDVLRMKNFPSPSLYEEKDNYHFELKRLDILEDLSQRLVIDWRQGAQRIVHFNWDVLAQKPVIKIEDHNEDAFTDYDDVIWSFSKMARLVGDPIKYSDIYKALSTVNGVYLVTDPVEHKQYVGSASGTEGIYGRWKTYAETEGRGGADENKGNKRLAAHLQANPGRYLELQYCILETLHKTGNELKDRKVALELESKYKLKLDTRNEETGLNCN